MKKILLIIVMLMTSLSLYGCNTSKKEVAQVTQDAEGFIVPEPSDWVTYITLVREYLYYRTSAVLKNNIDILWDRYPSLKTQSNVKTGINVEKLDIESLNQGFTLIDSNFNEEGYEPIKVKKEKDDRVVVLVHGGIGYLRNDFEESGGEILIKLHLEKQDGKWSVVKTDEYTLPEYKEWLEEKS